MTAVACMGGWCRVRESCPNYHAERRRWPSERRCARGTDGLVEDAPVVIRRPVGDWEGTTRQSPPASPFPGVTCQP